LLFVGEFTFLPLLGEEIHGITTYMYEKSKYLTILGA
jgi:hypothetical protein